MGPFEQRVIKLTELFSSSGRLQWVKRADEWLGSFEVDGNPYEIKLDYVDSFAAGKRLEWLGFDLSKLPEFYYDAELEFWESNFYRADLPRSQKYSVLGIQSPLVVLSTAVVGIQEFLTAVEPDVLQFEAIEPSRKKLYARMLTRFSHSRYISEKNKDGSRFALLHKDIF